MDPIADMLTIIRNGCRAQKNEVTAPYSRLKTEILRVLLEEGFINNFTLDNKKRKISIMLKYGKNGESVIRNLERKSKCSRRVYVSKYEIPYVLGGVGTAILTTSSGVLSDREARRKKIGGELIAYVY
ncbi:30S ribosomal protein S8 [candidate division WOR-3 bacterium RBG_13_43_14]|uniref:Small ribosomal subunit protein uS8 n=1 Tax=candidate division WOR-3 bacterium RBG_13_43_14 TaxID=1802590 RepID=A0A1F4UC03_UNCW3|nr:MAG: 30S ribosomal protein S8 [candidate division WOR-3 bacterium RBG_13_43_14]